MQETWANRGAAVLHEQFRYPSKSEDWKRQGEGEEKEVLPVKAYLSVAITDVSILSQEQTNVSSLSKSGSKSGSTPQNGGELRKNATIAWNTRSAGCIRNRFDTDSDFDFDFDFEKNASTG
jgi:hypothetical protein